MKKTIFCIVVLSSLGQACASYTYTVTEYQLLPDLSGTQSMLVTGNGGGGGFYAGDNTHVTVQSTSSPLEQGTRGLWEINLINSSNLFMSGGQVHEIDIHNDATATLTGGLIEAIYSYQTVQNPHITLYYSGTLPSVQVIGGFNYLTGNWQDGTPFSIYLHNTGYNVYGNFNFVPEPASVLLVGLGALLIRRKR